MAALASEVWQNRKRSSFRPWVKTYLPDMMWSDRYERKKRSQMSHRRIEARTVNRGLDTLRCGALFTTAVIRCAEP